MLFNDYFYELSKSMPNKTGISDLTKHEVVFHESISLYNVKH